MSTPDPKLVRNAYLDNKSEEPDEDFKEQLVNESGLSDEDIKKILTKVEGS